MPRKRRDPTYQSWAHMKDRCHNPNSHKYHLYGKRGITVCPEWRHSYETFLAQMGPRPEGTTLERLDNDKGYYLDNCVWADKTTQARNSIAAVMITHQGKTMCLAAWAEELGIPVGRLYTRRRLGMSVERLLYPGRYG